MIGCNEGAERTDRALRTPDSSRAERRERERGRMMGQRKEEEQKRLREIKGALIKGLSPLSFDRSKEVGKGGSFNENSMADDNCRLRL